LKKFLCVLLAVAAVCVAVTVSGCSDANSYDVTVNNTYSTMTDEQWREYMDSLTDAGAPKMQAAINRSLLSGVSIITSFNYKRTGFTGFFGSGEKTYNYRLLYTGAGVIVDIDKEKGDAYVVTNCHVVYDDSSVDIFSSDIYLYLYGQDTRDVNYSVRYNKVASDIYDYEVYNDENYRINADIVAASVTYDIALLKITNSEILKNSAAVAAGFSESDDVFAGEQVYAVGNPEGDGMSATAGIVSKESENIILNMSEKYPDSESYFKEYRVIRTDAAINGGNSGGGLYNASGELVGIVNSKSVSEEIDNMGYALPGSNVKRLWKLMRDTAGTFNKSSYGVTRAFLPANFDVLYSSAYLNSEGFTGISETVVVTEAGGGLKNGDRILKITVKRGDKTFEKLITRKYHVDDFLLEVRQGDKVTVTVSRDGGQTDISVTCTFKTVE